MIDDSDCNESVEEQLTTILESIGDGFCAFDVDWRFIYINQAAETIVGIPRDKLLGRIFWEMFPLMLSTPLEQEFRLAAKGEIRSFENFYKSSGRWFLNRCFPRKEGGISVYFKDITEHKLADEALLRERNVLQEVMNGAKNWHLVYLDRDFNFVRVNETYAANCGYLPEEMIGKNHFALYPDAENEEIFRQVRDSGEVLDVHDKPFVFPDHPERGVTYWDWTLSPVKNDAGEVTGLVFSLFETTSRKKAEDDLQASETQFRHLFEKQSVTMFLIDPVSGDVLDVNDAAAEYYGYSRDTLRAMNIKQIDCYPPDEHDAIVQQIRDGIINQFVTTHRLADGTLRAVEVHVSRIILQDQAVSFCIVHDITERKKAEAQLKAMNEELEQRVEQRTRELQETQSQYLHAEKLSAIGKLSASIAHEFNNPLQGVITILKGLKRRAILEDEDKELLDLAIEENERMKNLIRSLQDFNQPSAGKRVVMDVHASIDSLLLLYRSDFRRKGISIIRNYDEKLPQIKAIPDQIKQVILNLLTNAADACLPGGGTITIMTRQEGRKIAVAIKDTGTGISPEKLDLIFQPFYTTKSEVKGTGLGLSVCHGIIQNHHGNIIVESMEGKGSTFTMLLPVDGFNEVS
ncbi:MAG: PAS domain S-box protein [Desulforhopalus sp.]